MSVRRDADSGSDLLTRMVVVEKETERLRADVNALETEMRAVKVSFALKTAEYDKERGLASKIAWPVVIALATAAAFGVAGLLLRMYYLLR